MSIDQLDLILYDMYRMDAWLPPLFGKWTEDYKKASYSLPQCQVMNSKKTSTIQRKTSFMVSAYFVFDSFSCDTFNLGCKKAGDLFGSPA